MVLTSRSSEFVDSKRDESVVVGGGFVTGDAMLHTELLFLS
jgi:hypothetical protein